MKPNLKRWSALTISLVGHDNSETMAVLFNFLYIFLNSHVSSFIWNKSVARGSILDMKSVGTLALSNFMSYCWHGCKILGIKKKIKNFPWELT